MSWSPKRGEGRGRGRGPKGRPVWSARPLGGAVRRDHVQLPAFAPGSSGVALSLWPFCILLFTMCLNCPCMWLSLVLYSFFAFCCWGRHLSRSKCRRPNRGSQVQPVSVVLSLSPWSTRGLLGSSFCVPALLLNCSTLKKIEKRKQSSRSITSRMDL